MLINKVTRNSVMFCIADLDGQVVQAELTQAHLYDEGTMLVDVVLDNTRDSVQVMTVPVGRLKNIRSEVEDNGFR